MSVLKDPTRVDMPYKNETLRIEFSTHSCIVFQSETASFWCNMNECRKDFCVAITDSPVLEHVSTANARCEPVQAKTITGI